MRDLHQIGDIKIKIADKKWEFKQAKLEGRFRRLFDLIAIIWKLRSIPCQGNHWFVLF